MLKSKLFWSRYVELVIAFLTFGWLIADWSWEPLTAFVAAAASFVGCEIAFLRALAGSNAAAETQVRDPIQGHRLEDRKLYHRLIALLPSTGVIDFIDKNNMAGFSFHLDRLNPLDEFIHKWNNAEHEFLDPDLEHAKSELQTRCREYSGLIGCYTFPTNNGQQSVPPEWEIEQPEKFDRVVNELHAKAQQLVDAHKRLVRMARRKLNL